MAKHAFDADYYERFYENPRTRVASREDTERLAAFVFAYVEFLGLPVERAIDLGCGLGWWGDELATHHPDAEYVGVEVSAHLCEEHGWQQGSVVDWDDDEGFDLVVCQGVLQYLGARDADRAVRNLARLCRGVLYVEVLTEQDWRENVDRDLTDGAVHLRPGSWYRERLGRHFRNCGGGVFVHRDADVSLFELETLEAAPTRRRRGSARGR